MDPWTETELRITDLVSLGDQADHDSIFRFSKAIQREVGTWLGGDPPRFGPALQIDFAIGPPNCLLVCLSAVDDESESARKQLLDSIHELPVPQVCGLVAVSLFLTWDAPDSVPLDYDWIIQPFGDALRDADFEQEDDVKLRLYHSMSRMSPEYDPPVQPRQKPPLSSRRRHGDSDKSSPAGHPKGMTGGQELSEPIPDRPKTGWIDPEQLSEAISMDVEALRQRIREDPDPQFSYALALKLYGLDKVSEALEHLDTCLSQFPNDADLHCNRAGWSLQVANTKSALFHAGKTVELAPTWAAGYHIRGLVFASLEAWEQAEADFGQASALHETRVEGWLNLARARASLKKQELALEAIDRALECDPFHPDALALRIHLLRQSCDGPLLDSVMDRIDADLATAIRYTPPHPYFLQLRAERLLQSGDSDIAIDYCTAALELDESDAAALGLRGVIYLTLDEVDLAFSDLDRSIDLGNESPAVLEARGRIHLHRGEFELARLDGERAIGVDDEFVLAYLTLGNAFRSMEAPTAALEMLERVVELAPQWDVGYRALGDCHVERDDFDQAHRRYCQAVDCDPRNPVNWLQRGACQAQRGNPEKSLFDVNKAIELDRDFVSAYRVRASMSLSRRNLETAILDLSEVLRLLPDDIVSRFQRAQCYLATNKPEEAREDFDRVIELCPTLAAAYSGRARTWIESGDEARAAEDFREAVMQDPPSSDDFEISRILTEAAILMRSEDYGAALEKVAEALDINDGCDQAISLRASCFWHDEQFVEAVDDYTWLLQSFSDDDVDKFKRLSCLNNRGHVYVEMGEFEQALVDLDQAVELAESFGNLECQAYSLSARALAHAGLDQSERAIADFERSVDKRPENAWVYYNQALVYDKLEKPQDACVCFELALSLEEPPLTPRRRQRAKAYLARHAESEGEP